MADRSALDRSSHDAGYELSDVGPRWVALAGLGLAVTLAAIGLVVWALLATSQSDVQQSHPGRSAVEKTRQITPKPRLDPNPSAEAARINGEAEKTLTSYGWVDREAGIAHIPIGAAMRAMAEHGWPSPARDKP